MGIQVGYERLSVTSTAIGFTAATVTPKSRCAVIINEGGTLGFASARWRVDAAPTATVGTVLWPGAAMVIRGESNIRNIKFIRVGALIATVTGAFFSDINDAVAYMAVRESGDPEIELLSSAARSVPVATGQQYKTPRWRGVHIIVEVTAVSGTTPTLDIRVRGFDRVAAAYHSLNADPTDITAVGTYTYQVYPGASGGAVTQVTGLALPPLWGTNNTIGGTATPTFTYSETGYYMP